MLTIDLHKLSDSDTLLSELKYWVPPTPHQNHHPHRYFVLLDKIIENKHTSLSKHLSLLNPYSTIDFMAGQLSKRKRKPYDVGGPSSDQTGTVGGLGHWTFAENLIIVNGHRSETDNPTSTVDMHKQMPQHSYRSICGRYHDLSSRKMSPKEVSQLWHMWLL